MSWRLEVVHSTHFQYESEVIASFNEARMSPASIDMQYLLKHQFSVIPTASIYEYSDYFNTVVQSFDVQTPHTSLSIVAHSVVETFPQKDVLELIDWEVLDQKSITDEFSEYLELTPLVDEIYPPFQLRTLASPIAAVHFLSEFLRKKITYTSGATHVYSPASEAWHKGAGVCQDFTHTSLSILRSAGIPARYVSGYLYTGNGEIGEVVIGESHSWVEAWVGEWLPFDPTNGRPVGEDHILVAKGRDYHDVSPLKGIFSGGASRKTEVEVAIKRIG
jgi:transglutaminase-like putative cysteine protease